MLGGRINNYPYDFVEGTERKFEDWDVRDARFELHLDAPAIRVLLKILNDGHIRRGWSFRGGRPTIYGPRAACCFTEMPLYALLEYARSRSDAANVRPYGIALPRDEFFQAGGRPVIYGLTGEHREEGGAALPRWLHRSCGIGEEEQYRYVAMSLDEERRIDWSHEREWRWCDPADSCSCPGLPIWLAEEPITFTRSLIMVAMEIEVPIVLDNIKELFDAICSNYSDVYRKTTLENTRVFSVERLASHGELSRLDDLPSQSLSSFVRHSPSTDDIEWVTAVLDEASNAAALAARRYREEHRRSPNGDYVDVFGFASLAVKAPQSLLVDALISLKAVEAIGGVGYFIRGIFERHCQTGMLTEQEQAAEAAREVLCLHFPDAKFYVNSRMD